MPIPTGFVSPSSLEVESDASNCSVSDVEPGDDHVDSLVSISTCYHIAKV